MQKSTISILTKRIPWAFLACVILFFVLEYYVESRAMYILTISDRIINYKKEILSKHVTNGVDSILLGDSRTIGINTKKISDQISQDIGRPFSCYNFALPESGMRTYYALLSLYLEQHQSPRWIFFSISPYSLRYSDSVKEKDHDDQLHRFALMFPYNKGLRTMPLKAWPKYHYMEMEQMSKLVAYRKRIGNIIVNRKLPYDRYVPLWKVTYNRNGGVRQGNQNKTIPDWVFEDTRYYKNPFFEIQPDTEKWIVKFFELAEKNRIKIVMFNMPLARVIVERRHETGFYDDFESKIKEWSGRYPNFRFVGPVDGIYDNAYFLDQHHLGGRGFEQFEQDLARYILEDITEL